MTYAVMPRRSNRCTPFEPALTADCAHSGDLSPWLQTFINAQVIASSDSHQYNRYDLCSQHIDKVRTYPR